MERLHEMGLRQLASTIRQGGASIREVTTHFIDRIGRLDGRLKSFIRVTGDEAIATARRLDDELAELRRSDPGGSDPGGISPGRISPLFGVPHALKDNICASGVPTTCASAMLERFVPPYDATVAARLREAGSVLLGKTNLDEFAMGSSCENSAFFPTKNPWDLDMVPGGSSGGSAAAVAAGLVPFALGSDTGGSVRQPASLCGIVGLKPTYGAVSRWGVVAFASSLDQVGALARSVEDCAAVMNVIGGHDPLDSTSAPAPAGDYSRKIGMDVRGLRVGAPKEYMGEGAEPGVKEAVGEALKTLEGLGAIIEECSLPRTEYALSAYYIIACAEASSNLARFDGVKYGLREDASELVDLYQKTRSRGFGAEVKRRIMLGTYALSSGYYDAYYLKAQKARTLVKQDFDRAFERFDVLVGPTSPTVAFPLGSRIDDPVLMYLTDVFSLPVNLAGVPAISIPCGSSKGLPVGMQMIGRPFDEATLLMAAYAYEQASGAGRIRSRMLGEE